MTRLALLALLAPVAACAVAPLPDTARIQYGAFGDHEDPETRAINLSSWALAYPGRTRGNPGDAARAVASVDFLAGDLYANPRFQDISPIYKQQMLDARGEVRQALGVLPTAPSQLVVDRLLTAGNAIAAGDRPATLAALNTPAFTYGPERTLAVLNELPRLPVTNVATMRVSAAYLHTDDRCGFRCN